MCSEEEFLEIPQGQFLNGVNNGLYLTLDSEAFESSYDDEFSLSTGFLMTLSYPFTRPIVKQKGPKLFTELSFPKFCSSLIVSYIFLRTVVKKNGLFTVRLTVGGGALTVSKCENFGPIFPIIKMVK